MNRKVCALYLVSLALLIGDAAATDPKNMLEQLCSGAKNAPKPTKVSEVKAMIGLLKSDSTIDCPAKFVTATLELEPIVMLENVCSQEAVDAISNFWSAHRRSLSKTKKDLIKPLRRFVHSFGLQVSKVCQQTMISELEKAAQVSGVTADDIKLVADPIQVNIEKIFGTDIRVENLLAIVPAHRNVNKDKTKIDMEPIQKKIFDAINERCVSKFKPVYDTLITPIVRLAAIGIIYRGGSIQDEMSSFVNSDLYRTWFSAVLACEARAQYTAVVVPKLRKDEDGNKRMITVLDEEDEAELQEKIGLSLAELELVPPADYKVEVAINDLVLDEADSILMESIAKFKRTISATHKFHMRMIRKLPILLKIYADQKAIKIGLLPSEAKKKKLSRTKFGSAMSKLWVWSWLLGGALVSGAITTGMVFGAIALGGVPAVVIIMSGTVVLAFVITTALIGAFGPPKFD